MVRVPYTPIDNTNFRLPFLSVQLQLGGETVNSMGMVDSGAEMNLLPDSIAELLGLLWEHQPTPLVLSGRLASSEARLVTLHIVVPSMSETRLQQDFAWVRGVDIPVTLGQAGFFKAFNVTFYGAESYFDVSRGIG